MTRRYRVETMAGAVWGHYAQTDDATKAAIYYREARRTGHRTRVIDRSGTRLSLTHGTRGEVLWCVVPS